MTLKYKIAKGLFWIIASAVIIEGIKLFTKISLARILSPSDFGLMAIVLLLVSCFGLFQEGGFESALIQTKCDYQKAANSILLITPFIGLATSGLLFASAGIISDFYREPSLKLIIQCVSPIFFILSFKSAPSGILEKELRFNKKFFAEFIAVIGYLGVSLFLAHHGYGVWGLVWGYVISIILTVISIWLLAKWKPSFVFDRTITKSLFHFGKHIVGKGVLAFLLMQGDIAFIGKILGKIELGYYAMAYTFSHIAVFQITNMVSRVTYPVFASLQDDNEKLRAFFFKSATITLLAVTPCVIGVFCLSSAIPAFLGAHWDIPLMHATLRILCLYSFLRSINVIFGIFLQAIGKPFLITQALAVELVAFLLLIYPLTKTLNIIGAGLTMTIIMFGGGIWLLTQTNRILNISWKDIWDCSKPPLIGSFYLAIWLMLFLYLIRNSSPLIQIALSVITGAIFYTGTLYFLKKDTLYQFVGFIKQFFK